MTASEQFRAGIIRAIEITGKSGRQASMDAGCNENQINRFVSMDTNIRLDTLDAICTKGFGMSFDTVYRMGA